MRHKVLYHHLFSIILCIEAATSGVFPVFLSAAGSVNDRDGWVYVIDIRGNIYLFVELVI